MNSRPFFFLQTGTVLLLQPLKVLNDTEALHCKKKFNEVGGILICMIGWIWPKTCILKTGLTSLVYTVYSSSALPIHNNVISRVSFRWLFNDTEYKVASPNTGCLHIPVWKAQEQKKSLFKVLDIEWLENLGLGLFLVPKIIAQNEKTLEFEPLKKKKKYVCIRTGKYLSDAFHTAQNTDLIAWLF